MPASALMNVMMAAVRKAGRGLARDYGEVGNLQVSVKGPANFVTAADMRAEETLFRELSKARQGYCFLMEERGRVEGSDKTHCWIVDPLDGTTNFMHGIPLFAISVALQREDEIVAAVIYNPAMDELYVAERGQGAFFNDRRLRVAGRRELATCVVGTGIPHLGKREHGKFLEQQRRVMLEVSGVRRMGAAALDLAYVAAGRLDGFWEQGLSAWDIAAGVLMIREAGGYVSDFSGGASMLESGQICAGNEAVHRALLDILAKAG